jgi:hypothetical protein
MRRPSMRQSAVLSSLLVALHDKWQAVMQQRYRAPSVESVHSQVPHRLAWSAPESAEVQLWGVQSEVAPITAMAGRQNIRLVGCSCQSMHANASHLQKHCRLDTQG